MANAVTKSHFIPIAKACIETLQEETEGMSRIETILLCEALMEEVALWHEEVMEAFTPNN